MTEHCLNLQLYLRYSWTFQLHLTDNSANSICSGNETETAELKLLSKDTTLTISLLSPSVSSFSKLSIAPYFLHVNTSNNKKICSLLFTTKPRINNVVVDDISNAWVEPNHITSQNTVISKGATETGSLFTSLLTSVVADKSSPFNSTHYLALYLQNGDRIMTIDFVTSFYHIQSMYRA